MSVSVLTENQPHGVPNSGAPKAVSIRAAVKAATQQAHARLDAGLGRIDLTHSAGYRLFLKTIAAAHLPLEALLERSGIDRIVPDWPERSRAQALKRDLAALGETVEPQALGIERVDAPAAFGILYTLEGSRLGGRTLLDTVRRARANPPAEFLSHGDSRLWGRFCAQLEASPAAHAHVGAVIDGAQFAFATFETAMRRALDGGA
jgi:heme oxygenase